MSLTDQDATFWGFEYVADIFLGLAWSEVLRLIKIDILRFRRLVHFGKIKKQAGIACSDPRA